MQMERKSGRKRVKVDYAALNEAKFREKNVHHHWDQFNAFNPIDCDKGKLKYIRVEAQNEVFTDNDLKTLIDQSKLTTPILIPNANSNIVESYNKNIQLDFEIPNLNIDKLTELIGASHEVPIMNTMTQNNNLKKWDMSQWKDYFNSLEKDKILNVISLEFSNTDLGKLVRIPKVVRDLDLVCNLFDNKALYENLVTHAIECPNIQKYILMSVKGCLTDFHIDFAATSVYYSPVKGSKRFILFPPLKRNLKIYKRWCLSSNQNETWLPDLIPNLKPSEIRNLKLDQSVPDSYINNGLVVDVNKGDLLLLPSGWIHAVITLEDSLVFGGNFLNLISLENHLSIYQLELETKVGEQFKFPNFLAFIWLFAYSLTQSSDDLVISDEFELNCLHHLFDFLDLQWRLVNSPAKKSKSQKDHKYHLETIRRVKSSIPTEIIGDDIEQFLLLLKQFLKKTNDHIQSNAEDSRPSKRQRL